MLSCVQLFCDPMDCSPPGSSVHGILQARIGGGCHFFLQGIFPAQGPRRAHPFPRRQVPEESRAGPVPRGIGSSRLAATAWLLCCSYLSFHWDKPGSGTLWALDLGFTGGSLSKESTCSTEDAGDVGSIPGSGSGVPLPSPIQQSTDF